jgi:hypothetical protein
VIRADRTCRTRVDARRWRFGRDAFQASASRAQHGLSVLSAPPRLRRVDRGRGDVPASPDSTWGSTSADIPRMMLSCRHRRSRTGTWTISAGWRISLLGVGSRGWATGGSSATSDPPAIKRMMDGYVDLDRQRTPYDLVAIEPDQPGGDEQHSAAGLRDRAHVSIVRVHSSASSGPSSSPSIWTCRRRTAGARGPPGGGDHAELRDSAGAVHGRHCRGRTWCGKRTSSKILITECTSSSTTTTGPGGHAHAHRRSGRMAAGGREPVRDPGAHLAFAPTCRWPASGFQGRRRQACRRCSS